jgi:hypothetical protein
LPLSMVGDSAGIRMLIGIGAPLSEVGRQRTDVRRRWKKF